MKRFLFLSIIILISCTQLLAQVQLTRAQEDTAAKAIAATPVKSALSYSALSQFIQTNVTTGANGGFNFKSTLFGLHDLFSGGGKDSLSNYYLTRTAFMQRNTQLSFGINKASTTGDQLSRITAGLTIAVVNHRDKSIVNFVTEAGLSGYIKKENGSILTANIIYTTQYIIVPIFNNNIQDKVTLNAALIAATQEQAQKLSLNANWTEDDIDAILNKLNISPTVISKVHTAFEADFSMIATNAAAYQDTTHKTKPDANYQKIADSVFKTTGASADAILTAITNNYNNLGKKIDMGALFTISLNPGYNVKTGLPDTTSLSLRYLVGLGNNIDKPWSIDLQATGVSLRDSTAARKVFGHNALKCSLGFDKVFMRDSQDNPLLEAEFQGEYDNVLSGKFAHEAQQTVTANLVTSIRVSKEFTLPLTLKYDPKNAQFLGFLSVQWNLENSNSTSK